MNIVEILKNAPKVSCIARWLKIDFGDEQNDE